MTHPVTPGQYRTPWDARSRVLPPAHPHPAGVKLWKVIGFTALAQWAVLLAAAALELAQAVLSAA